MGAAGQTKQVTHDALLSESYITGRRAGLGGMSPSTFELQPGSSEYNEFMRGFTSGAAERASQVASRCRYHPEHLCNCGGRGLCLDVA